MLLGPTQRLLSAIRGVNLVLWSIKVLMEILQRRIEGIRTDCVVESVPEVKFVNKMRL